MSHLKFYSYDGFGKHNKENFHYSEALVVPPGPTIQLAGQGGWDRQTGKDFPVDFADEIEQAFANCDHALKDAGGKGMEQVYKLVFFLAPISDENIGACVACLKKWFPNHEPIVTGVGVARLAFEGMRVEMEAYAHLG